MGHGLQPASPPGQREAQWGLALDAAEVEVQVACTPFFEVAGIAAYHSSVILGRVEYHFGPRGIAKAATWASSTGLSTHSILPGLATALLSPTGPRTEVAFCGQTTLTGKQMLEALTPYFQSGTYDILRKNCNAFTDCALYFLLGERLGERYTRFEKRVAATAVSVGWLERITSDPSEPLLKYLNNPIAKDFSVEDVIVAVDREKKKQRLVTDLGAWWNSLGPCGCRCDRDVGPPEITQDFSVEDPPPGITSQDVMVAIDREGKKQQLVTDPGAWWDSLGPRRCRCDRDVGPPEITQVLTASTSVHDPGHEPSQNLTVQAKYPADDDSKDSLYAPRGSPWPSPLCTPR